MTFNRNDIDFIVDLARRVGNPDKAERLERDLIEILEFGQQAAIPSSKPSGEPERETNHPHESPSRP